MRGLIFSQNTAQLQTLISLNLSRAGRNKGAMTFTPLKSTRLSNKTVNLSNITLKDTVLLDDAEDKRIKGLNGVFHLQAPTSDASRPHPANIGGVKLWHNGILKPATISKLQHRFSTQEAWDTALLAMLFDEALTSRDFSEFGKLEGSFACVGYDTEAMEFYAFRNSIAPLFTDGRSLSSVALNNLWRQIEDGKIYRLDSRTLLWNTSGDDFLCSYNPYDAILKT